MKLPSSYQPQEYEANIYRLWEQNGVFEPVSRGRDDYFSIDLPPPNANGDLHMGHALTVAIQDSLVRFWRMRGRAVLYAPGADHAGFETWVVYEKKLNEQGKSRFDYNRDELYKLVWDFVQSNKHNFEAQLRSLGASLDWSRFTFTLDPKVVETAYGTFQKMWHDGLIYRGQRVVNFCTFHGTSFSDIEVVHEEEDTSLWHIGYPLTDGSGEIIVATTRPETMLGDTAVAVNPDDKRYKNLVGKTVRLPITDREVPIVADGMVDMKFGSGAVKVTPAHDPNDFEVAKRHKLPLIEVIATDGKINDNAPQQFRGLSVVEARQTVAAELDKSGSLRSTEAYRHSVGKCYKCGTVIEPLLREQWFVSMRPLADKALRHLDEISFYPASKKKQLQRYLTEVRDWNISRQIAWGIPIPAFVNQNDKNDWIFDTRVDQATIEVDGKTYQRDPDVFDTWFSSGHWPLVTLNYPEGDDFNKFYPLNLMETGGEILHQWVARMLMLGLYLTDQVPFKTVYIHGYVLAEDGAKMSKSLGNVINPVEAIAEYGSDALRMGLLTGRRPGINQGYHPAKIKAGRNFANKLWNIARFVEDKVGEDHTLRAQAAGQTLADHWLLKRVGETTAEVTKAIENYRLSEAYELVYDFVWHDLADWYIEASKSEVNLPLLAFALECALKFAHPFAPFVTEAIWQTLGWEGDTILAVQPLPSIPDYDEQKANTFNDLIEIITSARAISAAVGAKKPAMFFRNSPVLAENSGLIARLGRLGAVQESPAEKGKGTRIAKVGYDCWLDIDTGMARTYLDKLIDKKAEQQRLIDTLESRLENPGYIKNAPPAIVEESKHQLEEQQAMLKQTQVEIETFTKLING